MLSIGGKGSCHFVVLSVNVHMYVSVPYTAYDLQISGYTSKGLGPSSVVYPVLTDVAGLP